MVSADNLPHDVLGLIFDHLDAGNDLVAVSVVSSAFYAAAVSRLYSHLHFRCKQAKRIPLIKTPFAVVLAHPQFAAHVRSIEIKRLPVVHDRPRPDFIRDSAQVIKSCTGLTRFVYTSQAADSLPAYLPMLKDLNELKEFRLAAKLERNLTPALLAIRGRIQDLMLEHASYQVLDILPEWTESLSGSLTSLSLFMALDLNEDVFAAVISHLPKLTKLHVIKCPKIDHVTVLKWTSLTPELESLAFTTFEHPRQLQKAPIPLLRLRHLAIDTQSHSPSTTPALWGQIFNVIQPWSLPLTSIVLKMSHRLVVGESFIQFLAAGYGNTLTNLAFINCAVTVEASQCIALRCRKLRRLAFPVQHSEIKVVTRALQSAPELRELVDVGEDHVTHTVYNSITRDQVLSLMKAVPKLRTFVAPQRQWTGKGGRKGLEICLQKRQESDANAPWYLPNGDY